MRSPEDLAARVRRIAGVEAPSGLDKLHIDDARTIDQLARHLLARLHGQERVEAFELLVDLALPKLVEMAEGIARDIGLAADSQDLITEFLGQVFTEIPARPREVRSFLTEAEDAMRAEGERLVRSIADGDVPSVHLLGLLGTGLDVPESVEEAATAASASTLVREGGHERVVGICFHRLSLDERRVLRARDVEGLDVERIAERLGLTIRSCRDQLLQARRLLAQAVDDVLESLAHLERRTNVQQELGHLLYELVRACTLLLPEGRTHSPLTVVPESLPIIVGQIEGLDSDLGARVAALVAPLLDSEPRENDVLVVARRILSEAIALEGPIDRVRLMEASICRFAGEHERARNVLERLCRCAVESSTRITAQQVLSAIYLRLGMPERTVELASALLREDGEERVVLFNLATAYAHLRDALGFDRAAKRFARGDTIQAPPAWWLGLIESEAPWFAEQLHRPPEDIVRAFGMSAA